MNIRTVEHILVELNKITISKNYNLVACKEPSHVRYHALCLGVPQGSFLDPLLLLGIQVTSWSAD
jgi:hypothetical protein